MRKARIVIKDGIKEMPDGMKLMDTDNAEKIKQRIMDAIDDILKGTDYRRMNPPTFGVEKES